MKLRLIYVCLITAIFYGHSWIYAQDEGSEMLVEKVNLFTDRGMYIAGEKILFAACIYHPSRPGVPPISNVLYCELITPDGGKVAVGKYPMENSKCEGCLEIPVETVTGTYYLKAYTRFMRNEGPVGYHFTQLIIINPVKPDILPSNDQKPVPQQTGNEMEQDSEALFTVSIGEKVYSRREEVMFSLADNHNMAGSCRLLSLAVIPEPTVTRQFQAEFTAQTAADEVFFYPEIKGISLTGTLLDMDSGKPLPDKKVNLSIIGDKDFMASVTDSSGRFFFNLNGYLDDRDLFLCSEKIPGSHPKLLVDNDFCTRRFELPSPPLDLTEKEKKAALKLAVNNQVMKTYWKDSMNFTETESFQMPSFYGNPSKVLWLDKYIELPTMEEYFNEIPNEVRVRKADNKKYFRFSSTQTEMVIYDPLVLIDWVAVDDIDLVLSLSPRDISRIEIFNAPYLKGQIMFGGIISFISRKNDFAGIDLPNSGTFISYKFYHYCDVKTDETVLPENIPDGRNTIYWDPDICDEYEKMKNVSFTTPDTPGIYIILLRGVDHNGRVFSTSERIEIL